MANASICYSEPNIFILNLKLLSKCYIWPTKVSSFETIYVPGIRVFNNMANRNCQNIVISFLCTIWCQNCYCEGGPEEPFHL